jgi:DHA1 family bicyclomycin/chloramphenicol resistance-like MFS transporter
LNQPTVARVAPPIWILAVAVSGANVGISLLSPAIPDLRADLMATGDEAQLVLSGFLVMLGLGQLGAGTISDSIGRRPVMLSGALLFLLTGLGAMFAPTVEILIAMRVLQGLGAAACMVMGRVIISDSYERDEAGKQLSTITMFQAVVPLLGFGFGGMIADLVGWRGAVALMVLSAVTVLIGAFLLLQETRLQRTPAMALSRVLGSYLTLLMKPKFITNAGTCAVLTAGFFAMGGFMPYHFQRLGSSAFEFGLFFSFTALGYLTGNSLNRFLGPRLGLDRAAFCGSMLSFLSMSGLLVVALTDMAIQPVISFFLFFYGIANGLVIANAIIGAVRAAGPHSGAATGLCGALQMGLSGLLGSVIIGLGGDADFQLAVLICWLMVVVGIISAFLALERPLRR